MSEIIDKIYEEYLNSESFLVWTKDRERLNEEENLYGLLYEKFSEEYKKIFLKYISLRGTRQNEELKAAFTYGFKAAVRLLTESLKG